MKQLSKLSFFLSFGLTEIYFVVLKVHFLIIVFDLNKSGMVLRSGSFRNRKKMFRLIDTWSFVVSIGVQTILQIPTSRYRMCVGTDIHRRHDRDV